MKRCGHTHWLSLCTHDNDSTLFESDRLRALTAHLPNPDDGQPSLFVLIDNAAKSVALQELFGAKGTRGFTLKRSVGEVHHHLDLSSIFHGRPIYLADGDLAVTSLRRTTASLDRCDETRRRRLQRDPNRALDLSLDEIATIQDSSYCMFTNHNGVGSRHQTQGYHTIRPRDSYGRIPVWEIARAASAAQAIFSVKEISRIGAFQDPGTRENNPLISALAEAKVLFPLIEEPDFVISLGTGAPTIGVPNIDGPRSLWKDGAFRRICRLAWEKMRDRRTWHAFKIRSGFHRLDIEFDGAEPRLDDTRSMPGLRMNVQANHSVSQIIDDIARYAVASLFYFELESVPERHRNVHVAAGHILCISRESDPDFKAFINQLSRSSADFYLNNFPIPGVVGDRSFLAANGNLRKRVQLNIGDSFTMSLKQEGLEMCNISGSPSSIDNLIFARGLNAHFGRSGPTLK